tara:strand:+ start:99 stop:722 length:624 start_codon:yes stop_codon:yes gene_type:complete
MKKLLLLFIFPFFLFGQTNDTIETFSFNSSLEQPIGFGYSKIYKSTGFGSFWNIKFELGNISGNSGYNYTNDLGAMINYVAHSDNVETSFQGLHFGRSTTILLGIHIPIVNNLYISPGFGYLIFPERAQYNDYDAGGEFHFRTKRIYDLVSSIQLSAIISNRLFLQFGLDIFPDKEKSDYQHHNTLDRLKNNGLFSNFSFGLGYILK